jgi:hypothetical protein
MNAQPFAAQEPPPALGFREKALRLFRALDSLPAPVPRGAQDGQKLFEFTFSVQLYDN